MLFKRRHTDVPGLNATSMADISFMLLIFFLVTSSMDATRGLLRQMPPPADGQTVQAVAVKERNLLAVALAEDGRITCNGEPIDGPAALTERVAAFVDNADDDPALPEKSERELHLLGRMRVSDRHTITVEADRRATYDDYFQLQSAIVDGYRLLRERLAESRFHCAYSACTADERDVIALVYPQRISEHIATAAEEAEKGGTP